MKYLLDTNSCIYLLSGTQIAIMRRVAECTEGTIAISTIVFAEVAMGSQLGYPPEIAVLDDFLEQVVLLPFDEAAARAYATLPFKRARFDRLLAAQALAFDLAIVTNNERDFADIPHLRTENWTL